MQIVISGTTDPTARMTIKGDPVYIHRDGSFTHRLLFPDGEQEFELKLFGSDGQRVKLLKTEVRRSTRRVEVEAEGKKEE